MTDLIRQLRGYGEQLEAGMEVLEADDVRLVRVGDGDVRPVRERRPARNWPAWATVALAVGLVVAFGTVTWMAGVWQDEAAPVVDQPTLPSAPVTTVGGVTPITVPVVEGGLVHLSPAPIGLTTHIGFARSGDLLWAWDGEWEGGGAVRRPMVAYYRNGAWESLPSLWPTIRDVSGDPEGTVWAVTTQPAPEWILNQAPDLPEEGHVLWALEQGEWRQLSADVLAGHTPHGIEVDERIGLIGTATRESFGAIYGWDGRSVTGSEGPVGMDQGFAVTSDGSVWSSVGVNLYVGGAQGDSGLHRYDPRTAAWEPVRPLGGSEDVPAWLAPTPGGDLWVLLLPDWHADEAVWLLAYLDVAADEWTVYKLPGDDPTAFPFGAMAADDQSVWLSFEGELLRFDGRTLTSYRASAYEELGVAADGTLWVYRGEYPDGLWLVDLP